ncbi:hypothetical protein CREGCYN_15910 [Synechococcus sp. M16CYN]
MSYTIIILYFKNTTYIFTLYRQVIKYVEAMLYEPIMIDSYIIN